MTAAPPPTAGRYPSDWEFDLLLKDGSTAHLRPIRPDDATGLADLVARMSCESTNTTGSPGWDWSHPRPA